MSILATLDTWSIFLHNFQILICDKHDKTRVKTSDDMVIQKLQIVEN